MKFTTAALIATVAAYSQQDEAYFNSWQNRYGKSYRTKDEHDFRKNIFARNLAHIKHLNEQYRGHRGHVRFGMNHLSDLTSSEYRQRLGYKNHGAIKVMDQHLVTSRRLTAESPKVGAPTSIDWRTLGAVTSVKDQGQCGDCWAFSGIGAIEGAYANAGKGLTSFSEQQIINCLSVTDSSGSQVKPGCNGGIMDYVFEFAEQVQLELDTSDPYQAVVGACEQHPQVSDSVITGYNDISPDSTSLLNAVAQGPVAVAIDASDPTFQSYHSGVYNTCGTSLDHAVLAVGYGTTSDGLDYWLVKNSWGTGWGLNGYIQIERDMSSSAGVCGINMMPSQPYY